MMTKLNNLTTERLRQLIDQTRSMLMELTDELDRRKQVQQEHEIEYLEGHMKNAEVSLETIRDFISSLTKDLKYTKKDQ